MSVRRRSSSHVTLVLAGAAALAGCSRGAESSGKRYASRAECVADWGNEEDCKEQASTSGHGASSWIYYGAASSLFRGNSMGVRSGTGSVNDTTSGAPRSVSRGGFGSTGRSGVSS